MRQSLRLGQHFLQFAFPLGPAAAVVKPGGPGRNVMTRIFHAFSPYLSKNESLCMLGRHSHQGFAVFPVLWLLPFLQRALNLIFLQCHSAILDLLCAAPRLMAMCPLPPSLPPPVSQGGAVALNALLRWSRGGKRHRSGARTLHRGLTRVTSQWAAYV